MLNGDFETNFFVPFFLLSKYRFKYWDREHIEKYQNRKKKQIIEYAKKHSSYFKNFYKGIDNFNQLPYSNKTTMMDNFSQYNTLGLEKEKIEAFALDRYEKRDFKRRLEGIVVGMSSGTSGNKGLIITTKREEQYLKAIYASRLVFPKKLPVKAAFILRVSSPAYNYKKPWFSLTYISQLQVIEKIIEQLEELQPDVLAAAPSMLQMLGKYRKEGHLKINPQIIYSYAEVLDEQHKKIIQNYFDADMHQIYQGSEGTYAMTCSKGNLHINEDLISFELLNKDGTPTPDGQPSYRTLVTDLHKHSQPIIRYELNDILTIDTEKCTCGSSFKVIKSIQGRANDLIWGIRKTSKEPHFIYQDYIKRAIITASADIVDYQVMQQDYENIEIRLEFTKDANKHKIQDTVTENVHKIFEAYDCKTPKIAYVEGTPLFHPKSGKLIRVQSKINNL